MCNTVLLKSKDEAKFKLIAIINRWETLTGMRVLYVRSDNGGEYINHTLKEHFASRGLTHQLSAPYMHEQNGKAERLNRTLTDTVRTMLVHSKMNDRLWGEAMMYATKLYNVQYHR
jgi:transposase InsO family protein